MFKLIFNFYLYSKSNFKKKEIYGHDDNELPKILVSITKQLYLVNILFHTKKNEFIYINKKHLQCLYTNKIIYKKCGFTPPA